MNAWRIIDGRDHVIYGDASFDPSLEFVLAQKLGVAGELLFLLDSLRFPSLLPFCDAPSGRFFPLIGTLARLLGPGRVRSIVGDSLRANF
jgi:hypothetical protein